MKTREIMELKDEQSIKTIVPTMKIVFQIWWWMFWRKFLLVFFVGGITVSFVLSFVNGGERFLNSLVFTQLVLLTSIKCLNFTYNFFA